MHAHTHTHTQHAQTYTNTHTHKNTHFKIQKHMPIHSLIGVARSLRSMCDWAWRTAWAQTASFIGVGLNYRWVSRYGPLDVRTHIGTSVRTHTHIRAYTHTHTHTQKQHRPHTVPCVSSASCQTTQACSSAAGTTAPPPIDTGSTHCTGELHRCRAAAV
jgi:hypothetical protein